MSITIPRKCRKATYVVLVIVGVLGIAGGIVAPDLAEDAATRATSIGDALTAVLGIVGSASGVLALLHLGPADTDQPAAGTPPEAGDGTGD